MVWRSWTFPGVVGRQSRNLPSPVLSVCSRATSGEWFSLCSIWEKILVKKNLLYMYLLGCLICHIYNHISKWQIRVVLLTEGGHLQCSSSLSLERLPFPPLFPKYFIYINTFVFKLNEFGNSVLKRSFYLFRWQYTSNNEK